MNLHQVLTDRVTWSGVDATFTGEASEMGFPVGVTPRNFELVSHKTGEVLEVYGTGVDLDGEGDVIAWYFQPVNPNYDFRVIVLND